MRASCKEHKKGNINQSQSRKLGKRGVNGFGGEPGEEVEMIGHESLRIRERESNWIL